MNDKNKMEDILVNLKSVCDLYVHATVESNTPHIHTSFENALTDTLSMQNATFNTMNQKGWYQTQPVPQTKIEQTRQKTMQA